MYIIKKQSVNKFLKTVYFYFDNIEFTFSFLVRKIYLSAFQDNKKKYIKIFLKILIIHTLYIYALFYVYELTYLNYIRARFIQHQLLLY